MIIWQPWWHLLKIFLLAWWPWWRSCDNPCYNGWVFCDNPSWEHGWPLGWHWQPLWCWAKLEIISVDDKDDQATKGWPPIPVTTWQKCHFTTKVTTLDKTLIIHETAKIWPWQQVVTICNDCCDDLVMTLKIWKLHDYIYIWPKPIARRVFII